jgi:hypothetical protein
MEKIGRLMPKKVRDWTKKQLRYNDKKVSAEKFLGKIITKATIIGLVIAFIGYYILGTIMLDTVGLFIGVFALLFIFPLYSLSSKADGEGKKVEKILPDALQLIASNIKSGLTTEKSLLASALPEFGAFGIELKNVSKNLLSGEKIEKALMQVPKNIKSNVLDRTIWLIVKGIKSGGQISNLLVQLSSDLREENALKGEISANISMYIMLIFFSAAFGAPALFGISSFIVGVLAEQSEIGGISPEMIAEYGGQNPALSMLGGSSGAISEEFIIFFSEIALVVTCVSAAFVLGIISTGREKGGIRYIPVLLIIGFILFFVVRIVIESMFGTMMF